MKKYVKDSGVLKECSSNIPILTNAPSYVSNDFVYIVEGDGLYVGTNKILGSSTSSFIIGEIRQGWWSTAPEGWLICDGSSYLKTDYPDLYTLLGSSSEDPNDNTKFLVPDYRECVLRSRSNVNYIDSNGNYVSLDASIPGSILSARMPAHTHQIIDDTGHTHDWTLSSHTHGTLTNYGTYISSYYGRISDTMVTGKGLIGPVFTTATGTPTIGSTYPRIGFEDGTNTNVSITGTIGMSVDETYTADMSTVINDTVVRGYEIGVQTIIRAL